MDHTTAIIEDRSRVTSRVTSNINVLDSPVLDSHPITTSETWPDSSLAAALTPPVIEALQEVIQLSPLVPTTEFLTPSLSVDLRHELEAPVRDIHHAFARFLLIDVASGDATASRPTTAKSSTLHSGAGPGVSIRFGPSATTLKPIARLSKPTASRFRHAPINSRSCAAFTKPPSNTVS